MPLAEESVRPYGATSEKESIYCTMWNFFTAHKTLAVIVPFDGHREKMSHFIAHILNYFNFDKEDRRIPFSLHVIDGSMAKGTLLNIGFDLAREHGYFCFHDPDHLPIWADYRYAVQPTSLITSDLFGGVLAFNRADFERVDGFGRDDMAVRCERVGLKVWKRNGYYQSTLKPEIATGDPLSLLKYQVLDKTPIKVSGTTRAQAWRYKVGHLNS